MCKKIISGLLICVIIKISGASKEKCNKEEDLLQRCAMALPVLSSPEISFALTREELGKSCVGLKSGIRCVDNYTDVCMSPKERVMFREIYSGIAGVVNELCTEGDYQNEYLRHADCVKNVRPQYETCSSRYEVTLTTLRDHRQGDKYDMDDKDNSREGFLRTVCCSFQEYLRCSERTVQRSCGDEAALFTSAFLKSMSSKIIKRFCFEYRGQECGVTDGGGSRQTISLFLLSIAAISSLATNLCKYLDPA